MTTAWLAGGSGLVGGVLLRQLLDDAQFGKVISVGRRALQLAHPKLTQVLAELSSPSASGVMGALEPPAVAFSCLGTTIKKAGSREAFRAVDHGAVLAFARAAGQGPYAGRGRCEGDDRRGKGGHAGSSRHRRGRDSLTITRPSS